MSRGDALYQSNPIQSRKHEESSKKGQEASWGLRNCQKPSVLESVIHCLTWTTWFTLLLLLLWPLVQNRHSKFIMFLTVLMTSLGPSPHSSTPWQQTFSSCKGFFLVWLVLWAREISLWALIMRPWTPHCQWAATWPQKPSNLKQGLQ